MRRRLASAYPRLQEPHLHFGQQEVKRVTQIVFSERNQSIFTMSSRKYSHLPLSTSGQQECALVGMSLLQTPFFNKGSAFSKEERQDFGLEGLLPSQINSLEEQVERAYDQYRTQHTPLGKNTFMTSLKDQNDILYYRLIQSHLKEMFPIIYTPTEGEAIANYSRLFRKPGGLFLDIEDPDSIESTLDKWGPGEDVDIIACSDGEQILGADDLILMPPL